MGASPTVIIAFQNNRGGFFFQPHGKTPPGIRDWFFGFLDILCGFDIKRQLFHSYRSIGQHPYADNTAWIPRPFATLIGGKGLPPYRMSQSFVGRHSHADNCGW